MARFNSHSTHAAPTNAAPFSAVPVNAAATHRCRHAGAALLIACVLALPGCAVLAAADLAASAVIGTAGLVVDAAVGTVKIGGKAVGKAADAVFGSDPEPAPAP